MPLPSVRANADLGSAARRIVEGSLAVTGGEKVLVLYDQAHAELAQPLCEAIAVAGGEPLRLVLEELAPRPHTNVDPKITDAMEIAQATVLLCGFHGGEYAMRTELVAESLRRKLRHAHMVGLTPRSMLASFAVDPERIEEVARAVLERIRPSSVLRVRSAAGTDLRVRLDPRHRWVNHTGVIRAGQKENLPGGELVTCPADATGTYVANGTLGDATGSFAGNLTKGALVLHVEGGVVKRIEGTDVLLARRIQVAMRGVKNLDRVALVSLGTNVGMTEPVGEIFVDQTLPSFHLSVGLTFPERTGASWSAASWIGFTSTASDVEIDGTPIMKAGRYLVT